MWNFFFILMFSFNKNLICNAVGLGSSASSLAAYETILEIVKDVLSSRHFIWSLKKLTLGVIADFITFHVNKAC